MCVCVFIFKIISGCKNMFRNLCFKYMQQETNFTLHGTIKINGSKTKYQIIRSAVQQKYKYFLYCSFKSHCTRSVNKKKCFYQYVVLHVEK